MAQGIENDKSLLEDASTLLLFSYSKETKSTKNPSTTIPATDRSKAAAAALAKAAAIPFPPKRSMRVQGKVPNLSKKRKTSPVDQKGTSENTAAHPSWPVPDYIIVDPDDCIITCICNVNEGGDFLVQCNNCHRWQHRICYNVLENDEIPSDFLCNICKPRMKRSDIELARNIQQERLSVLSDAHNSEDNNDSFEKSNEANSLHNFTQLEICKYNDKYVKFFIEKHIDDDWVVPYSPIRDFSKQLSIEVKPYIQNIISKKTYKSNKVGLHLTGSCRKSDIIHEVLGEVDFQKSYLSDPKNHYRLWATPKPKVFFHPHWPIHIDARKSGNFTRFIRYSCHPNVELATVRTSANDDVEPIVRFVLRASRNIAKGEELQIAWQWDLRHPICQIISGTSTFDSLNEVDKYWLMHSVDAVLSNCECACGQENPNCNLYKVKKYAEDFCQSAKSNMDNRFTLKEILKKQPKCKKVTRTNEKVSKETSSKRELSLSSNSDADASNQSIDRTYKWGSEPKQLVDDGYHAIGKQQEQVATRSESFSSSSTVIASDVE